MAKGPQSRQHRERAQPSARKRLGLLEKHSDYQQRARSFNRKRTALKRLSQLAAERNPDEFYHGMISRTAGHSRTIHSLEEATAAGSLSGAIDTNVVKLMKSQDAAYLRMVRSVNFAKLATLKEQHLPRSGERLNKHERFVDSLEEVCHFSSHAAQQQQQDSKSPSKSLIEEEVQKEIEVREERVRLCEKTLRHLQVQVTAMQKGRRTKTGVDADGVPVYVYAAERKK